MKWGALTCTFIKERHIQETLKEQLKKTHFVGVLCFLFKSNFVPFYLLKLNDRTWLFLSASAENFYIQINKLCK